MNGLDNRGPVRNLRLLLRMDLLMCHLNILAAAQLSVLSISLWSSNRIAGAEGRLHHLALVVVGGKVLACKPAGVQVKHLQIGNAYVSLRRAQVSIIAQSGPRSSQAMYGHQVLKQPVAERRNSLLQSLLTHSIQQAQCGSGHGSLERSCYIATAWQSCNHDSRSVPLTAVSPCSSRLQATQACLATQPEA